MARAQMYLGLDIGGTKSAVVLGDATGAILDRVEFPSQAQRGPGPMLEDLCHHARKFSASASPRAVGVSIGGPLDAAKGVILSPPNLPGWDCFALKDHLQGRLNLPTFVEHDAAACCLAEHYWGAGGNATRLLYLTCGTGLGVGMVFDGRIYRGSHGSSAEIGHARIRPDGPLAYGKRGSIESYCSGGSLGRLAAFLYPQRWSDDSPPTPLDIANLARAGDVEAQNVLVTNANSVGDVCALLGDLLRPDLIILGSLARHLGSWWTTLVRDRFVQETLPGTSQMCAVTQSALGDRLQDCSALVVAVAGDCQRSASSL